MEKEKYTDEEIQMRKEKLLRAGSFINLGRIYHRGEAVEKSMHAALYYYTRAMGGCKIEEDRYIEKSYNLAY